MQNRCALGMGVLLVTAGGVLAQSLTPELRSPVRPEVRITPVDVPTQRAGWGGIGVQGDCTVVSSLTDANFEGDTFKLQAGFAEQEIAAASYQIAASEFPIQINAIEMIFGTSNATITTTTHWTVLIYDGTPDLGIVVAQFSSDDELLPHLVIGPGTAAVNLSVQIDPLDPEQIYVFNDSGTNTYSVGFRIDEHNQQTQNPCFFAPPSCCNAFPASDNTGLDFPDGNWLFAVDCGPLGCRAGWSRFSQLGVCKPTGDWALRATYTSTNCSDPVGACCLPDGSCELSTEGLCLADGGTYQGDNSDCGTVNCPEPTVPCCFAATGGCLSLTASDCAAAGGVVSGDPGQDCGDIVCFARGACCLPDGTCVDDLSPEECEQLSGIFQGDGTDCGTVDCPDPVGACCFSTGFCLELTEIDCVLTGSEWAGPGTTCADADGSGQADDCEVQATCEEDLNNDFIVDLTDLSILLGHFGDAGTKEEGDIDGNGIIDLTDLSRLLGRFGDSCP